MFIGIIVHMVWLSQKLNVENQALVIQYSFNTDAHTFTCILNLSHNHTAHPLTCTPPTHKHPRKQMGKTVKLDVHGVHFVSTPRSRGSRWTCSPCLKASVWWSRSPRSWCWLWIGVTGWRSRRGRTGSGGPVRPRSAPRRSLVGTTGTFCSCCSSSCRVRHKMALCAGRGAIMWFIDRGIIVTQRPLPCGEFDYFQLNHYDSHQVNFLREQALRLSQADH